MRRVVSQAIARTHLSKDTQDIVRLGAALIATIAGLVLGLLIAAAKSSYDTQSGQVRPITAKVILLNNLLAQYGPEAFPIRQRMREAIELHLEGLRAEGEDPPQPRAYATIVEVAT